MAETRTAKTPLTGITHHIRGDGLVTVCSTPSTVSSYMVPDDDARVAEIEMDQGRVVVKWTDDRFGTVWSILDGGAVVEIACHDDRAQRERYRQACREVDAENREHIVEAMQAFVARLMNEMGMEITEGDVQPELAVEDD